jgi:hypothetical protein
MGVRYRKSSGLTGHNQEVTTTDATQTTLPNSLTLASNEIMYFIISLVAVNSSNGDTWFHEFEGAIKNISGTTAIVDEVTEIFVAEDAGAVSFSATIEADNTTDSLFIKVTGVAATTINWKAVTQYSKLSL